MKYLTILFLLLVTVVHGKPKYENIKVTRLISVYDGDSFRVDIDSYPDVIGKNIGIRVRGIDTPEIRGECLSEKRLALRAKEMASHYLYHAREITLRNVSRDKYFRILADVYVDNKRLSDILLNSRLAYEYHGKKKRSWCN